MTNLVISPKSLPKSCCVPVVCCATTVAATSVRTKRRRSVSAGHGGAADEDGDRSVERAWVRSDVAVDDEQIRGPPGTHGPGHVSEADMVGCD